METKLDKSFQLSEVRNKSKLSVVHRLLNHKGAISINPPIQTDQVVGIEWVFGSNNVYRRFTSNFLAMV